MHGVSRLLFALPIIGSLLFAPVSADEVAPAPSLQFDDPDALAVTPELPAQPQWEIAATHGDWLIACLQNPVEPDAPPPCRMIQTLDMEADEQRVRLLEISIQLLDDGVHLVQMAFPQGVDLRPGIAMQIDDGDQFDAPYSVCVQGSCQVIANLGDDVVEQLRTGLVLRVGFRFFGEEQTVALEASLNGSHAAFADLAARAGN